MKNLAIAFGIIVISILAGISVVRNISFDFVITDIKIPSFPKFEVEILVSVINANFFSIFISDLFIEIYDDKILVAESTGKSGKIKLTKEARKDFAQTFYVYYTLSTVNKLIMNKGEPLAFDYKIKGKLYGIPVSFKKIF